MLRVFTVIRHAKDPSFFYGGLWSGNFYPALRRLGCDLVESQVDLLPTSRFMHVADKFRSQELEVRSRTTDRILDEVRRVHREQPIDLFLSYFYNAHFDPAGFDEIHRLGIPTVNFYCNSIYQFELVAAIAAKAQFSWHAERDARARYISAGARPIWVQMGADPDVYCSVEGLQRAAKACFVGQRYADRDRLLAHLIRAQVPVDIYGAGWGAPEPEIEEEQDDSAEDISTEATSFYLGRRVQQPGGWRAYLHVMQENVTRAGAIGGIARTIKQWQYRKGTRQLAPILATAAKGFAPDICQTFSEYEVVLNFSHVWADGRPGAELIPHVRLRDFEAPMCQTCYLTGHTDEISEFYDIGREIDTYRDAEELVDKVRFYLDRPVVAEQLRTAGWERARRDHTWDRRFQTLFEKIGLSAKSARS
ncbi:MAG: glycosyltransferase [Cyanobacteria bacterium P01_D01_bin.123]